jgi:uncharacterized membrane protein
MNTDLVSDARANEKRLIDRFMFFTDAVFAIVLTLLILELRPPEELMANDVELAHALGHVLPYVVAFAGSFALVGIFWFAHLQMTRNLRVFDWPVAVANLVFLFAIAFMPFTTALAATQNWTTLAFQLYATNIIAASVSQIVLFAMETRGQGKLVGGIKPRDRLYRLTRAAAPGLAFLLVLILTQTAWVEAAYLGVLSLPLFFLIARIVKPKPVAPA